MLCELDAVDRLVFDSNRPLMNSRSIARRHDVVVKLFKRERENVIAGLYRLRFATVNLLEFCL